MKKLFIMLLAFGMLATAWAALAQEQTQITFTAQEGCEVGIGFVDLSQYIANGQVLKGNERRNALRLYKTTYTGWPTRQIRVRKACVFGEDDIIYERMNKNKSVFDILIYSEEWGWMEANPGQEDTIGDVYSMSSVITHMNEVDSQRLR